nr:PEP-CTERM sorting domain-containing protein [Nitrospirota bacterium]
MLGVGSTDLRYRRVMDWDIEPTYFDEFVTIHGWPATNLLATSDNGFATADPLGGGHADLAGCGLNANFTDCGPADHGANFDFGFPALAAGDSQSFRIFYGGAGNETDALAALGAVGAEVYSFGKCNPSDERGGACSMPDGAPNTFIFAFAGVGGTPVPPSVPEPASLLLFGSGLAGLAAWRMRRKV